MHGNSDEDEERRRQEQELARLSPTDRLYGTGPRLTASGFEDRRSKRRTGRVVPLPLRLHPRVRAIFDAIMERDNHASAVVLFEVFVETYQQQHGAIDESQLPSDDELVRRYLREQGKRDVT